MTGQSTKLSYESGAVQCHLQIHQAIMNRMAANSAGCKTWCVALVSAIALVVTNDLKSAHLAIAAVPVAVLGVLDAYYLGLERRFIQSYRDFTVKLHAGQAEVGDIFIVNPGVGLKTNLISTASASASLAVWAFYSLLLLMLGAIHRYIL
jgi:hypothetical protein